MHATSFARPERIAGVCRLMLAVIAGVTGLAATGQEPAGLSFSVVTNIAQLRHLSSQEPGASHLIRLEGNVWWVSPAREKLVLHDASVNGSVPSIIVLTIVSGAVSLLSWPESCVSNIPAPSTMF